jgi:hypothetical protein
MFFLDRAHLLAHLDLSLVLFLLNSFLKDQALRDFRLANCSVNGTGQVGTRFQVFGRGKVRLIFSLFWLLALDGILAEVAPVRVDRRLYPR